MNITKLITLSIISMSFNIASLAMDHIYEENIYEATIRGRLDRVTEIIKANPNAVNARNQLQQTPLHWAAMGSHTSDVALFLLDHNADINAQDSTEQPLHCAIRLGHLDVARLLLLRGADVNGRDIDGMTPLSLAAKHGYETIALLLLENGADIFYRFRIQNWDLGIPSWVYAEGNGHKGLGQCLRDWDMYRTLVRWQALAFLMVEIPRLSENSPAQVLPRELLKYICNFVVHRSHSSNEIRQMAEQARNEQERAEQERRERKLAEQARNEQERAEQERREWEQQIRERRNRVLSCLGVGAAAITVAAALAAGLGMADQL